MSTTEKYTVVVSGQVAPGQSLEQVKAAFASLFKISAEKTETYFDGKPRVLRKNLPGQQAEVYAKALKKIGLGSRVVQQQEPAAVTAATLSLEPITPSGQASAAEEKPPEAPAPQSALSLQVDNDTKPAAAKGMLCPKCRTQQPVSEQCVECGIIFEKYRRYEQASAALGEPGAATSKTSATRESIMDSDAISVSNDPDSANLPALGAAAGAALLGALLWKGIAVMFGLELGLVAWAIGGAVGYAAMMLGGNGHVCGAICGVLVLAAILGGKVLTVNDFKVQLLDSVGDEQLWGAEAAELFEQLKVDAELYQQLDGSDESLREYIYTQAYTEADNARAVSDDDLDLFYEYTEPMLLWISATQPSFQQWQERTMDAVTEFSTMDLLMSDLGILDILFLVFGIGTAYRLGSGIRD